MALYFLRGGGGKEEGKRVERKGEQRGILLRLACSRQEEKDLKE